MERQAALTDWRTQHTEDVTSQYVGNVTTSVDVYI